MLADGEIKYLIEKAEVHLASDNNHEALRCYNLLISDSWPHPFIYQRRARVHSSLEDWDHAIDDLKKSIELCPDDACAYLDIGVYITFKLFYSGRNAIRDSHALLEEVIKHYKNCLERNPLIGTAWLNMIETYLFLRQWDDAISNYGACKPYIADKEHQLTLSWLGCLALTFAGDPLEPEDIEPLNNMKIIVPPDFHDVNQIRDILRELESENFDRGILIQANDIHQKFLGHFESSPIDKN